MIDKPQTKEPDIDPKTFEWLTERAKWMKLREEQPDEYYRLLDIELRYYEENSSRFIILRHPFMYVTVAEPPDELNKRFRLKRQLIKEALREGDIHKALVWYEKPYRIDAIRQWWRNRGREVVLLGCEFGLGDEGRVRIPDFTREEFAVALMEAWMAVEMPSQHPVSFYVSLFRDAGWITDVVDDDGVMSPKPNMPLTLYRGVQVKAYARRLSWTTDPAKAEWFARRWKERGYIYQITAQPEQLLARFTGRNESEYVVDIDNVKPRPKLIEVVEGGHGK